MGLKFSGLVLDPFLYNGFNLAILHSLGESPDKMEILHIFAIDFARIFAPSFKNLPETTQLMKPGFSYFGTCIITTFKDDK